MKILNSRCAFYILHCTEHIDILLSSVSAMLWPKNLVARPEALVCSMLGPQNPRRVRLPGSHSDKMENSRANCQIRLEPEYRMGSDVVEFKWYKLANETSWKNRPTFWHFENRYSLHTWSLGSAAWAVALKSGSAVLCRRPSHLWL